jgi:hypothetical protein
LISKTDRDFHYITGSRSKTENQRITESKKFHDRGSCGIVPTKKGPMIPMIPTGQVMVDPMERQKTRIPTTSREVFLEITGFILRF